MRVRRELVTTPLLLPALRPDLHRCCFLPTQAPPEVVPQAFEAERLQESLNGGKVAVVVVPNQVRQLASTHGEGAKEGTEAHVVGLVHRDVEAVGVSGDGWREGGRDWGEWTAVNRGLIRRSAPR